jgi:hypothetical protein
VPKAQRAIEAVGTTEPENTSQQPAQSLGGRFVDEAAFQLVSDALEALVKGAPEAAAGCTEAVDAAGAVAGAVVDGLGSL